MGCVSSKAAEPSPARSSGGASSSRSPSDKARRGSLSRLPAHAAQVPPCCSTCSKAASTKWGEMQANQRKYWLWDPEALTFLCRGCFRAAEEKRKAKNDARDKLRLAKIMKYGERVSKATSLRTLESGRQWCETGSFEAPLALSEAVEVRLLVWELERSRTEAAKPEFTAALKPAPLEPTAPAQLPVIAKSAAQRERLAASLQRVLLLRQLSPAQYQAVLGAMFERVVAAGETVIRQGDEGDNFYVVDDGEFDVFVSKGDAAPKLVTSYAAGGTFGELALLSGARRAATVVAGARGGSLWALGREAFTSTLVDATRRQRARYEKFLDALPFLAGLDPYDRGAMADCLCDVTFADGEAVTREGEVGDAFFIVLSGCAAALIRDEAEDSGQKEVMQYKEGMYFGEVALLRNEARKATVVARGELKCARMVVEDFRRILARPLKVALEEKVKSYNLQGRAGGRGGREDKFVR